MRELMTVDANGRSAVTARATSARVPVVVRDMSCWLVALCPYSVNPSDEPLTLHDGWPGPVKLVRVRGKWSVRAEVHAGDLDQHLSPQAESADDDAAEFLAGLPEYVQRMAALVPAEDWTPPPVELLSAWLTGRGYAPTVGDDGTVHLTLRSRGRDGQVRLARHADNLRMTMRLGAWSELESYTELSMLRLARACNAASRLVRVAWFERGVERRCEAQVDFTGLPVPTSGDNEFWPDMLQLAVSGMDLVLRRLGHELDVLADPANASLAQRVAALNADARRRPR
jgi:hypothetical protein